MLRAQLIEKHEIIEPPPILVAKLIKPGACCSGGGFGEVAGRLSNQGQLRGENSLVLDCALSIRERLRSLAVDPAAIGKAFQAD